MFVLISDDLSLPKSLQCGGFQKILEAAVIWFSGGGTKSVVHYDAVDNINCILDGEKTLVMFDKVRQNSQLNGGMNFLHIWYGNHDQVPWAAMLILS